MEDLMKRITSEPDKFGGRPCIRGLRIRVVDVLDLLAAGLRWRSRGAGKRWWRSVGRHNANDDCERVCLLGGSMRLSSFEHKWRRAGL